MEHNIVGPRQMAQHLHHHKRIVFYGAGLVGIMLSPGDTRRQRMATPELDACDDKVPFAYSRAAMQQRPEETQ